MTIFSTKAIAVLSALSSFTALFSSVKASDDTFANVFDVGVCNPVGKQKGAAVRWKNLGNGGTGFNFYVGAGDVGNGGCRVQTLQKPSQQMNPSNDGMPFTIQFSQNGIEDNLSANIQNLIANVVENESASLSTDLATYDEDNCPAVPPEEWNVILFYLRNDQEGNAQYRELTITKGSHSETFSGLELNPLGVDNNQVYGAIRVPEGFFTDGEIVTIAGNFEYDLPASNNEGARFEVLFVKLPDDVCPCVGSVCGDPHFTTWRGEKYDYHGKCDLELVTDSTFANGKGLAVHIRTEIIRQWSYIKSAAIQIDNDVLEIHGGADVQAYWVNKEYQGELTSIGGFPITYKKANSKSHSYVIHLGGGKDNVIEIRTYKDFVRVDFKNPNKAMYGNSVGLLGDFSTGKKLGRDGTTVFTDNLNEFGQEWQVLPGENLFYTLEGPQAPHDKCILPSELHAEEKRRRLGESKVTKLEAEVACLHAGMKDSDHDMCVADVMAADDLEMAYIYA